jgi:hypothetical protein
VHDHNSVLVLQLKGRTGNVNLKHREGTFTFSNLIIFDYRYHTVVLRKLLEDMGLKAKRGYVSVCCSAVAFIHITLIWRCQMDRIVFS